MMDFYWEQPVLISNWFNQEKNQRMGNPKEMKSPLRKNEIYGSDEIVAGAGDFGAKSSSIINYQNYNNIPILSKL